MTVNIEMGPSLSIKLTTMVMLIGFFGSLIVFFVGLHNNDNAFNLHTMNMYTSDTFYEHNIYGKEVDEYTLHAQSMRELFISYFALASLFVILLIFYERFSVLCDAKRKVLLHSKTNEKGNKNIEKAV